MTRNVKTLLVLWAVAATMLIGGFQFDYLYDKFCKITGYGGTTGQAEVNDSEVIDRTVRVHFDANVAGGLPWAFTPDQPYMDVKLGQSGVAFYSATNTYDEPIVGTANFNVTPIKAAPFFIKTECFCFTEQLIKPGETISMPVMFFVEPVMDEESRYDDIKSVTLSYTFFEVENPKDFDLSELDSEGAAQGRDTLN